MAVDVLISRGVPETHILFLNLIASPEGIESFAKRFPKLRVVTAYIDQVSYPGTAIWPILFRADSLYRTQGLNEKK